MIQIIHGRTFELMQKPPVAPSSLAGGDFADLLGALEKTSSPEIQAAASPATPPSTAQEPALADPNIAQWLTNYCARQGQTSVTIDPASWAAAPGAGNQFTNNAYGPDQIYNQVLCNIVGNSYAATTGANAAQLTGQLPGIPSEAAQKIYDDRLAAKNLQRLESGQPIDTSPYWSDPGSLKVGDRVYTSAELGYAGPGQSSGPQPVYLSVHDRINGTGSFYVPGFEGTVKGLEPGRYYTLDQLEKAGLAKGQESAQYYPGSWTLTAST